MATSDGINVTNCKRRREEQCFLAKYSMCDRQIHTNSVVLSVNQIVDYFNIYDSKLVPEDSVLLCQNHYTELKNVKRVCSLCNRRIKNPKYIRPIRHEKLKLAKHFAKTKNLDTRISSLSHTCIGCLKKLYAFEHGLPKDWVNTVPDMGVDSVSQLQSTLCQTIRAFVNVDNEQTTDISNDIEMGGLSSLSISKTFEDKLPLEVSVVNVSTNSNSFTHEANLNGNNVGNIVNGSNVESESSNGLNVTKSLNTNSNFSNSTNSPGSKIGANSGESEKIPISDLSNSTDTDFENEEQMAVNPLQHIRDLYVKKNDLIKCEGIDCHIKALYETVIYICDKFLESVALLMNSLFNFYIKVYSGCHPSKDVGSKLMNQLQLEHYITECFGDNLLLSSLDNIPRYGTLVTWKLTNVLYSLHKMTYLESIEHHCPNTRKSGLKKKNSSKNHKLSDEIKTLEKTIKILKPKVKKMNDEINADDKAGKFDLTTIDYKKFLLSYCDPIVWNFFLKLTANNKEMMKLNKRQFSWSEHYMEPFKSGHTIHPRLFLISLVNYIASSGYTRYPYHLGLADIIDKFTQSSTKCISMLNTLGITVSKISHKRHKVDIAKKTMEKDVLKKITDDAFFIVSIDNINVRNAYERVRAYTEKRGFDGSSIQISQPKPESIKLKDADFTDFSIQADSVDGDLFVRAPSRRDELSFYRSICRYFFKDLSAMQQIQSDHSYLCPESCETAAASSLRVAVRDNLTSESCALLDEFFSKQLNMKEWSCTTDKHSDSVLIGAETVSYPEYLSFVKLTAHPLQIFEETDGKMLKKIDIMPDQCSKVKPVTLLLKDGYFDTIFDCDSYYDNLDLSENVVMAIQNGNNLFRSIPSLSYNELLQCLAVANTLNPESVPERRPIKTSLTIEQKSSVRVMKLQRIQNTLAIDVDINCNDILYMNELEKAEYMQFQSDLFTYCFGKFERNPEDKSKVNLPGLKVYFARQRHPNTEKSHFVYHSIKNSDCDKKESLLDMLNDIYVDLKINKRFKYLVIVGDAKVYEQLLKIKEEYGMAMNWLIPFIGDWHLLLNYARHLLKLYGPAGLNSLVAKFHKGAVAKSVILGLSFDKTYAFLLQVWEAFYRCQIKMFLENKKEDTSKWNMGHISEMFETLTIRYNQRQVSNYKNISRILSNIQNELKGLEDQFLSFNMEQSEKDENYKFWNDFIHKDCIVFIGLFIAMRTSNWDLRNGCIKSMSEIFHVSESKYYRKLLPLHLKDIYTLPNSISEHMRNGGWVVNIKGNNTSSIALDEAHETLINLDVKDVLTGSDILAITENMHYLPYRADVHRNMFSSMVKSFDSGNHQEDSTTFINDFEINVQEYVSCLKDNALFKCCESTGIRVLKHLVTDEIAGTLERKDLMNIRNMGANNFKSYVECHLFNMYHGKTGGQKKFHNFAMAKVKKSGEQKTFFKDRSLLILKRSINWATVHGTNPGEIRTTCPLPIAICDYDGTPYQSPQKSSALSYFRKMYKDCFISGSLPCNIAVDLVIIEGMFAINTRPLKSHRYFKDYANLIFNSWVLKWFATKYNRNIKEVHLVFDFQDTSLVTPKYFERKRRDVGTEENSFMTVEDITLLPSNWCTFLKNRQNKKLLVNYLSEKLLDIGMTVLDAQQVLVVSGGFTEQGIVKKVSQKRVQGVPSMKNNHVEGDTLVYLHAVSSKYSKVLIYSPDSDVFFIGLPIAEKLREKTFIIQLKQSKYDQEYFNMSLFCETVKKTNSLRNVPSGNIASILQSLFICTGCDYISFFRYHSKVAFIQTFFKHADFISPKDGSLSNSLADLKNSCDHSLMSFFRLVGSVYMQGVLKAFETCIKSPEDLFNKYSNKDNDMENHLDFLARVRKAKLHGNVEEEQQLISADALKFHWLRSSYVAKIWHQADKSEIIFPDMSKYGWRIENDVLNVVWESEKTQQQLNIFLEMMLSGCNCSSTNSERICKGRCGCKSKGLPCRHSCRCLGKCNNPPSDPSPEAIFKQMMNYYDYVNPSSTSQNIEPNSILSDSSTSEMMSEIEDIDNDFEEELVQFVCDNVEDSTGNDQEVFDEQYNYNWLYNGIIGED